MLVWWNRSEGFQRDGDSRRLTRRITEMRVRAGSFAERRDLEEANRAPLPGAGDNFLSFSQTEPGDHSLFFRSTNSLDETPLVFILFDHPNGLPKPDGQLVT